MPFKRNVYLSLLLLTCITCNSRTDRGGGICLSFDDRTVREWFGLIPLLEAHNARATFFITQADSLSPEELVMLDSLARNGHEIGSHGALHVNAEEYIREHGYRAYLRDEVDRSLDVMTRLGFEPVSFAYPYGAKYWFTDWLLGRRFKTIRSVSTLPAGADIIALDEIYHDHRSRNVSALGVDVNGGLTPAMITHAVQRATDRREVLMLYGHAPVTDGDSLYRFDTALLEHILREANRAGLSFYTHRELVR